MRVQITHIPAMLLFVGCVPSDPPKPPHVTPATAPSAPAADPDGEALPARPTTQSPTRFEAVDPAAAGLRFTHRWNTAAKHRWEFANAFAGGGVALGDYDGDGRVDVYLTRPAGGGRLFRNLGDWKFEDVTQAAGLADEGWTTGPSFVDLDADGDLDLFVGAYRGPCRAYINTGGRFEDRAAAMGLAFEGATVTAAFADYDRDGDLDAYLLTNRMPPDRELKGQAQRVGGAVQVPEADRPYVMAMERAPNDVVFANAGQRDRLLRNDDGVFVDASAQAGIDGYDIGLSVRWWDFDDDGWLDLYVSNDFFTPDRLYRNVDGLRFVDVTQMALPHTPWFSMGAEAGDLDGDGWLDLLATDMSGTTHFKQKLSMGDMSDDGWFLEWAKPRQYMRNALYLNTGTGRFAEAAYLTGMANTDWTWSPRFADFDEDGRLDVFVTNGMTRDFSDSDLRQRLKDSGRWQAGDLEFWKDAPRRDEVNLAFRNRGDLDFEAVGVRWGLAAKGISFGAAVGDLDGDGDPDLVVNDFEAPPRLYRNTTHGTHRLQVRLEGPPGNPGAIGAMVRVKAGDRVFLRDRASSSGFMSADDATVHVGLGALTRVDDIEVRWPDGRVTHTGPRPADRRYTVRWAKTGQVEGPSPPDLAFTPPTPLRRAPHRERAYNDYQRQPLLPMQHSQLGPGVAVGDVDGDGHDDLWIGGAAGQPGALMVNRPGGFARPAAPALVADAAAEDLGGLFFDADGDGDQDLYVVSGGVEAEPGAVVFQDRLYLNDGQGGLSRDANALPALTDSGAAVTAGDVDGDGDLDLFVGGRVVPGQYPKAPASRLLINEGGRFADRTPQVAPGLGAAGLVTAAVWVDLDRDGDVDLVLAREWGPVQVWRNEKGALSDATAELGLARHQGWWNAVVPADVDNDGDLDLVAGNLGLNTKYHASRDTPTRIYYGPFGPGGRHHIVEAEFEGETLFPVRGRSCSSAAMPTLADRFPTYTDFAKAPLGNIYGDLGLDDALKLEANTLESGTFYNEDGRFVFRPFPRRAQLGPTYGLAVEDFDGDGRLDLYLAQNFFGPQRETGRFDGAVGQLLQGGPAGFVAVPVERSGLLMPFDGTAAVAPDLNRDGHPDLLVAANNTLPVVFHRRKKAASRVAVRLAGPKGNPTGVGARITLVLDDGSRLRREVLAGGGYLSQPAPVARFGIPAGRAAKTVTVEWPGGQRSSQPASGAEVRVPYPG